MGLQDSRPKIKAGEGWVDYRKRTSRVMSMWWVKMKLPTMAENNAGQVWTAMAWAADDGDVLVMMALRSILRWWNRSAQGIIDPMNVSKWKRKWSFHDRGVGIGYSDGEGKEWVPAQERRRDCGPLEDDNTAHETPDKDGHGCALQNTKGVESYGS